jgi:hypothetical protein
MNERPALKLIWKVGLFYLVFMVLYALYRFFPVFPLSIIAGVSESNFQHYKATFFSFLIADLIEFLLLRRQTRLSVSFWYSRLLAAVFAPWVVFLLWHIAPAIYGKFPTVGLEILYANLITILVGGVVVTLERAFARLDYTPALKGLIWGLVAISVLLYMVFTFSHLPWADVFIEPEWH